MNKKLLMVILIPILLITIVGVVGYGIANGSIKGDKSLKTTTQSVNGDTQQQDSSTADKNAPVLSSSPSPTNTQEPIQSEAPELTNKEEPVTDPPQIAPGSNAQEEKIEPLNAPPEPGIFTRHGPQAPGWNPTKKYLFYGDIINSRLGILEDNASFKIADYSIANNGANTTSQMLEKINDDFADRKYDKVFMMAGVYDLWNGQTVDNITSNYKELVRIIKAKDPDCKLYIQTVLPFGTAALNKNSRISNEKVQELNNNLRSLAGQSGAEFLDIASLYANADGKLADEYSDDGVHLKVSAYSRWINYINKFLK